MSAIRLAAGDMSTPREARWYEDFPALDQPDSTYAADLAARNDALFARVRALPPMPEPVVLPCADDWLESYASRDYLPESED